MKISIMQPYLFPYIGYFQLINYSNKFVFLDDVTYKKKGWIDRNKILLENSEFYFKIPIKNMSRNKNINITLIDQEKYSLWCSKFLKTINHCYKNSPYYENVFKLLSNILNKKYKYISEIAIESIIVICKYLDIKTDLYISSNLSFNPNHDAESKLIDICKTLKATSYVNMINGKDLYSYDNFKKNNIELKFLHQEIINYKQFNNNFIPSLSILDVIMFNSIDQINKIHLNKYD
jgi:hypothetical protein